jgi:hypothetical protein
MSASCSPRPLLGERRAASFETAGKTLHEDAGIRLWTLDEDKNSPFGSVLIASIKTKMHAISPEVAEGLQLAVDMAEKDYQGVVIWSGDDPFSAGADLQAMLPAFMAVGVSAIDEAEAHLQQTMLKLRYANVPVISAIRGHGAGRRLRDRGAQRTPCGGHGKLHRPGGSGRGPGARRRRPGLHCAPRGGELRHVHRSRTC